MVIKSPYKTEGSSFNAETVDEIHTVLDILRSQIERNFVEHELQHELLEVIETAMDSIAELEEE